MLVVAHAGQGNHHGAVQRQDGGTQPPALPPPALSEAVQLASQVECREAEARKGNCQRETAGVTLAGGEQQGRRAPRASCLPPCPPPGTGPHWHQAPSQQSVLLLEPPWYETFNHESDLPGLQGVKIHPISFIRSFVHSFNDNIMGICHVLDGHYSIFRCGE